jgi:hypothetical protein
MVRNQEDNKMKILKNINHKILLLVSIISYSTLYTTSNAQGIIQATKVLIDKDQQNLERSTRSLKDPSKAGDKTVILNENNLSGNTGSKTPLTTKNISIDNNSTTDPVNIKRRTSRRTLLSDGTISDSGSLAKNKIVHEEVESIMFTPEEMIKIKEALDALHAKTPLASLEESKQISGDEAPKVSPIKEQSKMYLDAILYISKTNWIVWINGQKIITEDNDPDNSIYISFITNGKAKVKWSMGITKWRVLTGKQEVDEEVYHINKKTNKIELEFTLRTNQTYSLITNNITEGRK